MMQLNLSMIGFGNVGQEFARLLLSRRGWIREETSIDVQITAISTKTKGSLLNGDGLDLSMVLEAMRRHGNLFGIEHGSTGQTPMEIIGACGADIMIELTPLNIDSGQPAIDHIRAAFENGMHVITANKGPIAYAYRELRGIADEKGLLLRFEGTVMDGTPVFSLVERTLPGCEVLGLSGVLNSTCNYVLTEMAGGRTMPEALEGARILGITEADPSLDIDGWDAAAKIAVLANVLMDAGTSPKRVDRKGIRGINRVNIEDEATRGRKFRLIASTEREGGGVRASVRPEPIGQDSQFWSVNGTSSALTIGTDLMGEITIIESNPTIKQTAYAVFSDLLLIAESIKGV